MTGDEPVPPGDPVGSEAPGPHPVPPGRGQANVVTISARSRLTAAVRAALLAVAIILGVAAVVRDREGFLDALAAIGWSRTILALLLTLVGLLASAEVWRHTVGSLAGSLDRRAAQRVFFVTQLGKYLPGAVWTVAAQIDAARRLGLSRSRVGLASLLFIGYHVATGAVIASALLWFAAPELVATYRLLALAALVGGLVTLTPPFLRWALRLTSRASRGTVPIADLTARGVALPVAWMGVTWLWYGAASAILVTPLAVGETPLRIVMLVTGAYAFAYAAGVLALPLPAGAGAREVALVLVIAPVVGVSGATSVAVVLRMLHTVGDLTLAAATRLYRG